MRLLDDKLAEAFLHEPTVEGECIICDMDEENEVVVLRQRLTEGESRDSPMEGEAESEKVDQAVNVRA